MYQISLGLVSAWLLLPLAGYEIPRAQVILYVFMGYGLNGALEHLFQELVQWRFLSTTGKIYQTAFGIQLPQVSLSQKKVPQSVLEIKRALQISIQRYSAFAIMEKPKTKEQPLLLLLPISTVIYRLRYRNTGHLPALSFWDIRKLERFIFHLVVVLSIKASQVYS